MSRFSLPRLSLLALFAAAAALPVGFVSAAIPCGELPVIEADPMMPIPMIYLELPRPFEEAFMRGQAVDRADATELEGDAAAPVVLAAENQFRCLGYGNTVAFAGNSTPQQRVNMFAVPQVDATWTYIDVDSLTVVEPGTPMQLTDGRFVVDYAVVANGSLYQTGELTFLENGGELYLDGATVAESMKLNGEPITVDLAERFTREIKIVEVTQGDQVLFQNMEEEHSASIVIVDPASETIFEGWAGGTTLIGGEDSNLFVVHNLEPGEYAVTVTFSESDITYNVTLLVSGGEATPEAATPAS